MFRKKVLACLSIFLFLALWVWGTASAEVLIISHPNVKEKSLAKKEIKIIFLGKKVHWKDKSRIHAAIMVEGDLFEDFLLTYVNKTENQFTNYWRKMIFTGKGCPPKRFESSAELITFVTQTPGAIGFIKAGTAIKNVKVINVE